MELLPDFQLLRPRDIDELVAMRAAHPGARLLAGGTDLLPNMRRGLIDTETVIAVSDCADLQNIAVTDDGLAIGAGVTLQALGEHRQVRRDYPALAEAAGEIAGPTHRAMGTVGGNICLDTRCIFYNQSEWWRASNDYCLKYRGETCHVVPTSKKCYAAYSGDLAAALVIYDAEVEIAGPGGRRRIGIGELLVDDGMDYLMLAADEVLLAAHLPKSTSDLIAGYRKIRVRGSIDFPLAGVALGLCLDGDKVDTLRIGLIGTNSHPVLIDASEELGGAPLDDHAATGVERLVHKAVSPVRTGLIQPQYRRRAVAALAANLARELADGI